MTEVKLDYIVQNLTQEQLRKVADFQAKVAHIQDLPSFEEHVLQDPQQHYRANTLYAKGEQTAPAPSSLRFDVSVIKTKAFRDAVSGLTPQTLRAGIWQNVKHDDPDSLVVRHLEARNWDIDAALCMMFSSVKWRIENNVADGLLGGGDQKVFETATNGTGEDQKLASEFMAQIRSGKSFTNGVDRKGRPLMFTRVCKHNPSAQSLKGMERYVVFQIENARMLLRPPVTDASVVFDLGGFTMANMDWNAIRLLTAGLEDKYPESTGATYVYRAPWIIGGIWNVVKHWMPGKEAQKVIFVKDAEGLSEFVDLKYIPAEIGGTGNYEYIYTDPQPGENDLMKDTAKRDEILHVRQQLIDEYEALSIEWVDLVQLESARDGFISVGGMDGDMVAKAIESSTSKSAAEALRKKREIRGKLQKNYFELDPYVRGRCHGDRIGVKPVDQYGDESAR